MKNLAEVTVGLNQTIYDVIEKITANRKQFVLVLSDDLHLVGIITDGDVRRGLLRGLSTDKNVRHITNTNPITATPCDPRESIKRIMKDNHIRQCPIVDADNKLRKIEYLQDFPQQSEISNLVVIMAGGIGERLRPLTLEKPKPLVKVYGTPILENIIRNLRDHGFINICISVNYKAEQIIEYFQDGKSLGVNIDYIHENKRMGTAGSLTLIEKRPNQPILVMNSDLVTNVDYSALLHFHEEYSPSITMCVKDYDFRIPYGVVQSDGSKVVELREKPVEKFHVNAGMYVLQPTLIEHIPDNTFYDMPQLIQQLIAENLTVLAYPVFEQWIDIANREDLERV